MSIVRLSRTKLLLVGYVGDYGELSHAHTLHHRSPLLAVAGSGDRAGVSPRRLVVYNRQTRVPVKTLCFPSTVRGCAWTRAQLAVQIDAEVHVFDLLTLAHLATFPCHTAPVLATDRRLVVPSRTDPGAVNLYHAFNLHLEHTFVAHQSALETMAANDAGTRLATSSVTRTLVRVFELPAGTRLWTFRLDLWASGAPVAALRFCPRTQYLAVCRGDGDVAVCALRHESAFGENIDDDEYCVLDVGHDARSLAEKGWDWFAHSWSRDEPCQRPTLTFAASTTGPASVQLVYEANANDNDSRELKAWVATSAGVVRRLRLHECQRPSAGTMRWSEQAVTAATDREESVFDVLPQQR